MSRSTSRLKPPQTEIEKIIRLYNQGHLEKVVLRGEYLAKKYPRSILIFDILGAAYLGLENNEKSVKSYCKVLQIDPDNTDALNNLGMLFYEQGLFQKAAELYQQVVRIEPNFADAHFNLGNALVEINDVKKAVASYEVALTFKSEDPEILLQYAKALSKLGKFDNAINCFSDVLTFGTNSSNVQTYIDNVVEQKTEIENLISDYAKLNNAENNSAEVFHFSGVVFQLKQFYDAALDNFKQAIKIKPNYAEAYVSLGNTLRSKNDLDGAIKSFKVAIKLEPNLHTGYVHIGDSLMERDELDQAIKYFEEALKIKYDYSTAYNSLGFAQKKNGDLNAAIQNYRLAIEFNPDSLEAHNNLGSALKLQGKLDASLAIFRKAIEIGPNSSEIYFNFANTLSETGDLEGAIGAYQKALDINPDYAKAHLNLGFTLLNDGNFKAGWCGYEARLKTPQFTPVNLITKKPKWNTTDKGRVLLTSEQGVGDMIMFSSMIPEIQNLCDKIIVQLDERLLPLFKRSFSNKISFYSREVLIPESQYDTHISMGSCAQYLRPNLESFKRSSGPFLTANKKLSARLRSQILRESDKIIYGLTWRGGKRNRSKASSKSIELVELAKILNHKDIQIVNLQYGNTDQELAELKSQTGIDVLNISEIDNFNNIDGLTALIQACDHVVSVDNLTVHIAGALGKKASVLLPYASDWRWGQKGLDSYWHASLELLRQDKVSDWRAPLAALRHDLLAHF